jgi:hypothetical protein
MPVNLCKRLHLSAALLVLFATGNASLAATATGTVRDPYGMPVAGATVLVYSAGVRKGYSTFCPTCYVDCGKRATTDADGNFSIAGLDDELLFDLIVLQEGHTPTWIKRLDTQTGASAPAVLKPRPANTEAPNTVLARILDMHGNAVPDALVEVRGLSVGNGGGLFGGFPDSLAVSDRYGDVELFAKEPAGMAGRAPVAGLYLEVKPRGMAPKLYTAAVGRERQEIRVSDGATVHGRLVSRGKPVANAELVMLTLNRGNSAPYSPLHIGTDDKGRFSITNVPIGRVWSLAGNAESLATPGVTETRFVATNRDGETVNVGDIEVKPGFSLAGRVVLSDGKPIPADMRLSLYTDRGDNRTVTLPPDGKFEFKGVAGAYMLAPAVRGYRAADDNYLETLVDRNIAGLTLTLVPAPLPGQRMPPSL